MSRRLLPQAMPGQGPDWAALRAGFRWTIPPDFSIPEACCDSWARSDPERVALIDLTAGEERWTYGRLKAASDGLAASMAARGVVRGDRVGVLLPQGAMVPVAHFAAQKLGAIALPLFTLFGDDALAFRLRDAGARAVVTDVTNLDRLMALDLPDLRVVYATGGGPAPVLDLQEEIGRATGSFAPVPVGAEDPAVMIYTSGTTGAPKGALHAHRFLLGHLPSMELTHEGFPRPGDVGWTPADWAWIGGLMDMAMPCLFYGVPLIAQARGKFDPEAAWALVRDRGIRSAFLPPTALKLMRAARVPVGVRLRSVSSGGESLGGELLDWGQSELGCPINEIYGQTECNLVITQAAGFMAVRPGAMGQALPGFDVAVITPDGAPVPDGEIGEIAVRRGAASMFLGYWNRPDQTAAKFAGDWLRTGDLGRRDAEGYFTYVARDDDLITSAGYRIGPSEIEDCLMGDPDVVMAAAVGVPDPVRTEVVRAFVVLRDGADWTPAAEARLIARVRDRVGRHLAPRSVERVHTLPMTATGKVIRRALRERG
ncbi:MAG: AMP-binding protein [Gemmobacter sp.]